MGKSSILTDAIRAPLKQAGFKKPRPSTWYRNNLETISVLNLQCSQWGPQYYINISIWIKALGDVENPPFYKCPIRLRWENIIPENELPPPALLDLENTSISNADRLSSVSSLIERFVIPFFDQTTTINDLRELYQNNPGIMMIVFNEALPFLNEKNEHDCKD